MSGFASLHVHSQMSLLDAMPTPEEVAGRAKALGMCACAMTDHGNLYGIPRFHAECRKIGLRSILGSEMYMVPDHKSRSQEREKGARRHLTVLAKDAVGWRNLMKLSTLSFREGFYYKPRIDESLLFENSEGLIVLSGCQSGVLSKAAVEGGADAAEPVAARYREALGDRYYLELIALDPTSERTAIALTVQELHRRTGIPVVVTNDVHYLAPEDATVHSYLTRVGPGKTRGYRCDELWMKDADAIWGTYTRLWGGTAIRKGVVLGGIERTLEIAGRCEDYEIGSGQDISKIEVVAA